MGGFFEWLFGALRTFFLWVFEAIAAFGDTVLDAVLKGISLVIDPQYVLEFTELLAQANSILPISEAVAYGVAVFTVWVNVVVYRVAKSFIPTLAGT